MRRLILIATLPLLMGAHDGKCGSICDELAGGWSVTAAPPATVMLACSDPRADQTVIAFPPEAMGLGEMLIAPSPSGKLIEFHGGGPSVRIDGTLDPVTLGVRFELKDPLGNGIRCSGILHKFTNPGGSAGWETRTACDSGTAGTAVCLLDPAVKVTLLVQRILMERAPSGACSVPPRNAVWANLQQSPETRHILLGWTPRPRCR